jgi:hypothetical protein
VLQAPRSRRALAARAAAEREDLLGWIMTTFPCLRWWVLARGAPSAPGIGVDVSDNMASHPGEVKQGAAHPEKSWRS